jgi:osmotically-inducible protein OsmY
MKMKTMKTDLQIQNDVVNELNFEPILTGSEIGVTVTNDFVTLSGTVDTYAKKKAAENAAKRIACVKGVSLHINVTPSTTGRRSDSEIAAMTFNALKSHSELPTDKINVKVENGCVTLTGEVPWTFQKTAVYTAIQNLSGVRGIVNGLEVKPTLAPKQVSPSEIKQQINSAFHRSATINPGKINIETIGGKVILTGVVGSWAEQHEAEYLACSAPGVCALENKLTILPAGYGSTNSGSFATTNSSSFGLTHPVNFGFTNSEITS